MKIKKIKQSAGIVATVVDNLESESITDALSANQGRILNGNLKKESGFITSKDMIKGTIGGGNGKYYNLTFSNIYEETPIVLVSFYSKRVMSYYGFIRCMAVNITNTGCTLCIDEQNLDDAKAGISYLIIPVK